MMNAADFVELKKYQKSTASQSHKLALQRFAKNLSKQAKAQTVTDCEAFLTILQRAAVQVSGGKHPAVRMIDDLKAVLIGVGLRDDNRNTGPYALEYGAFADSGFKAEFKEGGGNQVQHATAGLVLGFSGKLEGWIAQFIEDVEADDLLYDAALPLGDSLTDKNYATLHIRVKNALASSPSEYSKEKWRPDQGFGR